MGIEVGATHIEKKHATVQLETIQNAELNFMLHLKRQAVEVHIHEYRDVKFTMTGYVQEKKAKPCIKKSRLEINVPRNSLSHRSNVMQGFLQKNKFIELGNYLNFRIEFKKTNLVIP
jgi:polyisoprenoid-binding protein YceI